MTSHTILPIQWRSKAWRTVLQSRTRSPTPSPMVTETSILRLSLTPLPGEVRVDTITYTITDDNVNFDTATVRYVVAAVNPGKRPPVQR